MRWFFLLLLMLNVLYYVWHQQEAPLRPKEVTPLALYRGAQQNIRLLSEAGAVGSVEVGNAPASQCLYLGGNIPQDRAHTIEQRLMSLDIQTEFAKRPDDSGGIYWLRIAPDSRRLVSDALMNGLNQDFPELKSKIMSCEGIATSD